MAIGPCLTWKLTKCLLILLITKKHTKQNKNAVQEHMGYIKYSNAVSFERYTIEMVFLEVFEDSRLENFMTNGAPKTKSFYLSQF